MDIKKFAASLSPAECAELLVLLRQQPVEPVPTPSAPRFTKDDTTEIITDHQTDLEWLVGPDQDTTWHEASWWVPSLKNDWRLPTIVELTKLHQVGAGNRNIDPLFNISGWRVWSKHRDDCREARGFSFYRGTYDCYDCSDSDKARCFAVRARKT